MTETVGIIGLGSLGALMARAFSEEGFDVVGFDVDDKRVADVVGGPIRPASSPAAVAKESDVVVVVVGTSEQVESVLFGPDGVTTGATGTVTVAITSTVHPNACTDWATRFESSGDLVDAPIARGPLIPDRGAVALFGGPDTVVARLTPMFEAAIGATVHLGRVGAGQCGKLVNNQLFWTCHLANVEAVRVAKAFGIESEVLLDALTRGSGDNYALHRWGAVSDDWVADDLDKTLALAGALGLNVPLTEKVRELYDGIELNQAWRLLDDAESQ
ncbi:NAD(P)-binding domain-containing protein [Haladaptatus sp. DJG-WS-42]|uniref:NAD(P)-dependent oxidoreductase n=1 Tax=Haladaptatus sp. DJG-WS-42 TaxID=3120516 RepID=UPI0030D5B112